MMHQADATCVLERLLMDLSLDFRVMMPRSDSLHDFVVDQLELLGVRTRFSEKYIQVFVGDDDSSMVDEMHQVGDQGSDARMKVGDFVQDREY